MQKTSLKLLSCFFTIASLRKSTICSALFLRMSLEHIIPPFKITWQPINLRIDSGGLGIGIDVRTSHAAFAASFLSAMKAAFEIYLLLHDDIVNGKSIPYVQQF